MISYLCSKLRSIKCTVCAKNNRLKWESVDLAKKKKMVSARNNNNDCINKCYVELWFISAVNWFIYNAIIANLIGEIGHVWRACEFTRVCCVLLHSVLLIACQTRSQRGSQNAIFHKFIDLFLLAVIFDFYYEHWTSITPERLKYAVRVNHVSYTWRERNKTMYENTAVLFTSTMRYK